MCCCGILTEEHESVIIMCVDKCLIAVVPLFSMCVGDFINSFESLRMLIQSNSRHRCFGNPQQQQAVESPGRIGQSMSCNDVRKIAPPKVPSPVYATKARSARSTPESMRANRPVYSNGGGCGRRAELFDDDSTPLVGELEL